MKYIILIGGQKASVDDEDFDKINKFRWRLNPGGYVICNLGGTTAKMHRMVMNFPMQEVDHADLNKLNNCKDNLRLASSTQNKANRIVQINNKLRMKGVSYHKRSGKWQAKIAFNHKQVWLGVFDSPEKAKEAYNSKAVELFGKFARQ